MEGRILIPDPGISEAYAEALKNNRFELFEDPIEASKKSYFKMICVPVLSEEMSADLRAVNEVATSIGKGLKKGDVISLNPSVPPGTTEDVIVPIIEKTSGLSVERDFCMVYNPERSMKDVHCKILKKIILLLYHRLVLTVKRYLTHFIR